ncbi:NAD-dependent succinate-semialdehyde dehydrogenase [Paraburkholderia sp. Ac-20342]|uniref:NAD-dependent succinate-semialdehyde dehydrogenase n=1 Tax=Paraburkholderia sp. Ac-20342 TaxID=2703889 RepID=UPI00197D659F|nr:NAD-dependent succinate-semialdehyde dehydrogenase [Paraburkholderia sp. Ac-20342]MBN3846624.1 NAD-dependent succinate-semialdehyde dehydrogenase [Paraburkholderia sp. Ac-20342]
MSENQVALPPLRDPSLLREACFIAGEWHAGDASSAIAVTNPANDLLIGTVPRLGATEVRHCIESARTALPAWSAKTGKERAAILRRWYELMLDNQDDLATIMTCEQGKPLAESRGEILYAASFLEWFAEEAKRVYGDTIPAHTADRRIVVLKQPIGVCAAITPWNFPAAMLTRKIGPALAAGCTIVLKPASQTPFSALALCVLAERAGVPRGVLSCVTGNAAAIGDELCRNPVVRKLSFTGSTEIGKVLLEKCAATVKKTSMELGGNAPFIVFDDADLDAAVAGAIAAKFRNAGQTCVCVNRFFVQDSVYDAFVEKLGVAVRALTVGNGLDAATKIGPLIDGNAVAKVREHVDDALAHGASVVVGGNGHAAGAQFFEPTVLAGATPAMKIFREETFGPVAPVFRFTSEAEAIRLANDTEFGLASYFYGRDIGRIWRVAEALEYGMVGINEGLISTEVAPFGGVKESGLGREGSKYGIDDYLEMKYLCMGGIA